MKFYLVITDYDDDAPDYQLYKDKQAAIKEFYRRVGEYLFEYLRDNVMEGKGYVQKLPEWFPSCIVDEFYFCINDDTEFYIEEIELEDSLDS